MGNKASGRMNPKNATLPVKVRPGWLKRMDQRSLIARGLLQRLTDVSDQLGGLDELSPIERSLAERWIHIEAVAMGMEAELRAGKPVHVPDYMSAVDRLHGIGKTLGLKRRAKPTQTLAEFIAAEPDDTEDGQ